MHFCISKFHRCYKTWTPFLDLWFIFCQIENVTLLTNSGYFSQIVGGGISDDENITLGSSPNFLLLLCNVIVVSKRHYGDKKDMTSKVFGCSSGIPEHVPKLAKVNDSKTFCHVTKILCDMFFLLYLLGCDLLISGMVASLLCQKVIIFLPLGNCRCWQNRASFGESQLLNLFYKRKRKST